MEFNYNVSLKSQIESVKMNILYILRNNLWNRTNLCCGTFNKGKKLSIGDEQDKTRSCLGDVTLITK